MTQIVVMLFLTIVGVDANNFPVMGNYSAPTKVTLEECMDTARLVNSDPTSSQIVVCLPLLEKTST